MTRSINCVTETYIELQASIYQLKRKTIVTVNTLYTRLKQINQILYALNMDTKCFPEPTAKICWLLSTPSSTTTIYVYLRTRFWRRLQNVLVKFSHPRLYDNFLAAFIIYD